MPLTCTDTTDLQQSIMHLGLVRPSCQSGFSWRLSTVSPLNQKAQTLVCTGKVLEKQPHSDISKQWSCDSPITPLQMVWMWTLHPGSEKDFFFLTWLRKCVKKLFWDWYRRAGGVRHSKSVLKRLHHCKTGREAVCPSLFFPGHMRKLFNVAKWLSRLKMCYRSNWQHSPVDSGRQWQL